MPEQEKHLLAGYYPEDDAANELKQSTRTLRLWRQQGTGPAWVKIGRKIFYAEAALLAWIKSLEQQPVRSLLGRSGRAFSRKVAGRRQAHRPGLPPLPESGGAS
jgi:hypothetical protein